MIRSATHILALFLAGVALLLPPDVVAVALVGGTEGLVPSVTTGLWLTKLLLLVGAGLLWLVPSQLEQLGRSEPVAPRGISDTLEWTRTDLYLVLALLLISMVLRIPGLNDGLWYDEIQTLVDYVRLPAGEILARYDSPNNHILFSLLAHHAVVIFSESAWALRFPAMILGVVSIPIVYGFGRQIASRSEAFLAAAFLAVSYHHVWFSQNARGYTGLLVGTVATSWVFLRLLAARKVRPELVVGYSVIAALMVWTHLTGAVTVVAHGVVWLLAVMDNPRRATAPTSLAILISLTVAGLFSMALYGPILPQMTGTLAGGGSAPVDTAWKDPTWLVFESLRNLSSGIPGGWVALVVAVVVALIGVQAYGRQSPLVLSVLLLPAALIAILILGTGRNLWPRFFFFVAGFAALIAVRGGATIVRRLAPSAKAWAWELGLGLGVILLSALMVPRAWGPKQDFPAALQYVTDARTDGDAVISVDLTRYPLHEYLELDWEVVESPDVLAQVEGTHARTWVLYTFPVRLAATFPELWDKLQTEYRTATVVPGTVGGGDIIILVKP